MEVFRSEFDAAWEFGGLWISVWHPALSGRLARFKAALELLDYMRGKGGVWFARLDQVCAHVQQLIAKGRWSPRVETLPVYRAHSRNSQRTAEATARYRLARFRGGRHTRNVSRRALALPICLSRSTMSSAVAGSEPFRQIVARPKRHVCATTCRLSVTFLP
jgi:hypothetical protein